MSDVTDKLAELRTVLQSFPAGSSRDAEFELQLIAAIEALRAECLSRGAYMHHHPYTGDAAVVDAIITDAAPMLAGGK